MSGADFSSKFQNQAYSKNPVKSESSGISVCPPISHSRSPRERRPLASKLPIFAATMGARHLTRADGEGGSVPSRRFASGPAVDMFLR